MRKLWYQIIPVLFDEHKQQVQWSPRLARIKQAA